MGRDIPFTEFSSEDFDEFHRRLRDESRILMDWFSRESFETTRGVCGLELEAWLVDENYLASPCNEEFLENVNDPLVVPELSKFNFEINSTPHEVEGGLLGNMETELLRLWRHCEIQAAKTGSKVLAIGILPTVRDESLTIENMSSLKRYSALNNQVFQLRGGKPMRIRIEGRDCLHVVREDVMMEAAATSLQIHLQVSPREALRTYNAAQVLSAPMVAVAANSPFLFGKDLWDETRIPTFEQAVSVASFRDVHGQVVGRVTFGTGYGRNSLLEPFLENLNGFPVLLPLVFDEDPGWLSHLRLHNGTIWRWNRPLIGLGSDGTPHLRIEHRTPAAGPTIKDIIANIAFFVGMIQYFARADIPLEKGISFEDARANFYCAARDGLRAEIQWTGGGRHLLQTLVLETLLPAAREGLMAAGLDRAHIHHFIDEVLACRVRSGQNGAGWQRAFMKKYGFDLQAMTHDYFENQKLNLPVHQWTV